MDKRPLGILDSGLGGLAIYKAIVKELPYENTLYLADHAFFPYGAKTPVDINRRLLTLMNFFVAKNCKALVIACNTITTSAVSLLRQLYQLPIIGTEPAIKPALEQNRSENILVLATPPTVKSPHFQKLIERYDLKGQVKALACPGLADAIEANRYLPLLKTILKSVKYRYSAIVLACTHYILIKDVIKKLAPSGTLIIDPSPAISRQTRKILTEAGLLNNSLRPTHKFFTTGDPAKIKNSIIFSPCAL